jgi:hypothetical protein
MSDQVYKYNKYTIRDDFNALMEEKGQGYYWLDFSLWLPGLQRQFGERELYITLVPVSETVVIIVDGQPSQTLRTPEGIWLYIKDFV